ncbi:MAG: DUF3578 domain-containing protein, partial [Bacteroidales bacterium]|nr:DUF3578 domain-containing protein [Bacteroidales bacterium]
MIKPNILEEKYWIFSEFIKSKDGNPFVAFSKSPYINEEENYKYDVYSNASQALGVDKWKKEDIGSGAIFEAVNAAVHTKINVAGKAVDHNLIDWRVKDQFRQYSVDRQTEQLLFDFYKNERQDSECFEMFHKQGLPYQLIAFLYFIKDNNRYLPISQKAFDNIFRKLGISDFKTSGNASWENYSTFITILKQVKDFINKKDPEATFIDAHSFLWILQQIDMEENISFDQQLIMFLKQAKTDNLKTNHYVSHYQGTKVKVSFGIGGKAKIPWISFLKGDNTTSKGIYPVYLYYKEVERLILAYGISETNTPKLSWDVPDKKTIKEFYQLNFAKDPFRYGASYVYKVYDVNNLPSAETLNEDLNQIIDQYHEIIHNGEEMTPEPELIIPLDFETKSFIEALDKSGLQYSNKLITRFIASLLTKPFLILTGLSGSGKTKLAQAFAQWICEDESQYKLIPVGADWTNREPLLGYPNALKPEEYVKPDSGVLDLIIQANDHPELPHFLILDEMNLSIVERYFADFLSVMESKKNIPLYPEGSVNNGVPAKLGIPQNLFIIGTVNIDETTNMFSPKVLDRANTIEFRVTRKEMQTFLNGASEVNMDALTGKGAASAKSFLNMVVNQLSNPADMDNIKETLIKFFGELKKTGAEFGYRSALEILRLIHHLSVLDQSLGTNEMIDIAIMQKLLPKLHGSRRKICPVLETLGGFCLKENGNIIKDVFDKPEFDFEAPEVLYPLSLEKITRMYRGATENGFAS